MALGVLKCRVCGKEYKGCRTSHPNDGVFRWQDVACCPEHGAEYLRQVLEARGELVSEPEQKVLIQIVQEFADTGESITYKSIWLEDYEEVPVDLGYDPVP